MSRVLGLVLLLALSPVLAQELPDHDIRVFDLVLFKGEYRLENPVSVAVEVGYENQPVFRGSEILFTKMEGETANIWRWSAGQKARALVKTPLSEFSPTPMPSGGVSTVRVEEDGTQRLWKYSPELGFQLLFETIKPVGYHVWSGSNLALFVLGEPHRLEVTRLGQESTLVVASRIGRCLQKVPGRDAVSFTVEEGKRHRLNCYDFGTGKTKSLRLLPGESQDYVWLDQDTILSSDGQSVLMADVEGAISWESLPGAKLQGVSRMALSADKHKLAVVFVKP